MWKIQTSSLIINVKERKIFTFQLTWASICKSQFTKTPLLRCRDLCTSVTLRTRPAGLKILIGSHILDKSKDCGETIMVPLSPKIKMDLRKVSYPTLKKYEVTEASMTIENQQYLGEKDFLTRLIWIYRQGYPFLDIDIDGVALR